MTSAADYKGHVGFVPGVEFFFFVLGPWSIVLGPSSLVLLLRQCQSLTCASERFSPACRELMADTRHTHVAQPRTKNTVC